MNRFLNHFFDETQSKQPIISVHKNALRQYLLSESGSDYINHKESLFEKGGEIMSRPFYLTVLSILLVVGILTWFSVLEKESIFSPKPANAQEIVQDAILKFRQLDPDEQQQLEKMVVADLTASLAEAQHASDLHIVPEEEIVRIDKDPYQQTDSQPMFGLEPQDSQIVELQQGETQSSMAPGTMVFMGEGKLEVLKGVQVLRYTNKQGVKTILGIDKHGIPVMKRVVLDKDSFSVQPQWQEVE